jgi:hypothetical protein
LGSAVCRPGDSIGDCVILGELGRGDMGVVCRAHQVELDRHMALKLIRPDVAADAGFKIILCKNEYSMWGVHRSGLLA